MLTDINYTGSQTGKIAEKEIYMQVNRLSTGFQEQLKSATNYNTQRFETLFNKENSVVGDDGKVDFSSLEVEDLDITQGQIASFLGNFTDEVIKAFSTKFPEIATADNPLQQPNDPANPQGQKTFSA